MVRSCRWCQSSFEVTDEDLAFYEKVSPVFGGKKYLIPPPTLCPECRQQRRLAIRNERVWYNRKCDLCGKTTVSIYSPDKPYVVFCLECWWGDTWQGNTYGRDFDFSRPAFEQFLELKKTVPRMALTHHNSTNSEYTNQAENNKDAYLLTSSGENEKCCYGHWLQYCLGCFDCLLAEKSQHCYQCVNISSCYQCFFAQNCSGCSDSLFLYDCKGCSKCIGCYGLRNKQYYVKNQPVSQEEFEKVSTMLNGSYKDLLLFQKEFERSIQKFCRQYYTGFGNENSSGDYLQHTKNAQNSFDCRNAENITNCQAAWDKIDNCQDIMEVDHMNFCYEVQGAVKDDMVCFSTQCNESNNVLYSDLCYFSHDLFLCTGLLHKSYCILNKQYSKEEYEELVPRIIESMRRLPALQDKQMMATPPTSSSEEGSLEWPASRSFSEGWGEFFPPSLSPFGYNETVAMEYFPLTKEEALAKGFNWSDYEPPKPDVQKVIPASKLPDNIKDIPDDILNWAIECEVTNKPFRIIKQELQFYRDHNLPVPRRHPDQRHKDRMALRNPRKLYERQCDCTKEEHNHSTQVETRHGASLQSEPNRCSVTFQTTYSPDRPEKVYCEQCYLKEVY